MSELKSQVFTVEEAAQRLRVSRATLYRIAETNEIRISKIRGRSIITGGEIARYIKRLDQQTA